MCGPLERSAGPQQLRRCRRPCHLQPGARPSAFRPRLHHRRRRRSERQLRRLLLRRLCQVQLRGLLLLRRKQLPQLRQLLLFLQGQLSTLFQQRKQRLLQRLLLQLPVFQQRWILLFPLLPVLLRRQWLQRRSLQLQPRSCSRPCTSACCSRLHWR